MPSRLYLSIYANDLTADLRDAPVAAARLGVQALTLHPVSLGVRLLDLTDTGLRDLSRAIASPGLSLSAIELPPVLSQADGLARSPQPDFQKLIDSLTSYLPIARALNSSRPSSPPALLCDLGGLPAAWADAQPEQPKPEQTAKSSGLAGGLVLPTAADIRLYVSPPEPISSKPASPGQIHPSLTSDLTNFLTTIASLADRTGVNVVCRASLSSLDSLTKIVASVQSPSLKAELDCHALLADGLSPSAGLHLLANLLGHVRLRNGLRGQAGRLQPTPLHQGHLNIPELLALLLEADYTGPALPDTTGLPNAPAALTQAVQWLTSNALK